MTILEATTPTDARTDPPARRLTIGTIDWAGLGLAFLAAFILLMGTAIPQNMARQFGWFGDYWYEIAGAISRFAIAGLGVAYLAMTGGLARAGITNMVGLRGRIGPGIRSSWLLPIMALLPAIGLLTTSFQPTGTIASWTLYISATVLYEGVVFRGLIFPFLARRWAANPNGVRQAAIASSVLFGLAHIHPVAVVMAGCTGFALLRLQLDVRHVIPGLILHFVYDTLSQFPLDSMGEEQAGLGGIGTVLVAPLTLIVTVLAYRAMGRTTASLDEQMERTS